MPGGAKKKQKSEALNILRAMFPESRYLVGNHSDLTVFLLVMLVGMWGIVLFPPLLRVRQHSSPVTSVATFNKSLQALGSQGSAQGRWIVMPAAPSDRRPGSSAVERRRKVFTFFVGLALATFLLALVPALRWLLWIHLVTDICLATLVGLLFVLRGVPGVSSGETSGRSERRPLGQRLPQRDMPAAGAGAETPYVSAVSHAGSAGPNNGSRPGRFEPQGHGRFQPEGHGYRMLSEPPVNELLVRPRAGEPTSIKVLRPDDPPAFRITRAVEGPLAAANGSSITVFRSAPRTVPSSNLKPGLRRRAMFLDEEEEFLQAQGL